jgi:hypothetical protein
MKLGLMIHQSESKEYGPEFSGATIPSDQINQPFLILHYVLSHRFSNQEIPYFSNRNYLTCFQLIYLTLISSNWAPPARTGLLFLSFKKQGIP